MPSAVITKTIIMNMALSHIKQTNFLTAPTDNSEQAQVCNIWYDPSRRDALRACDWHFAGANVALMPLGDIGTATDNPTVQAKQDILPGWVWTYLYPPHCVRIRKVYNPVFADFPEILTDPFRDQSQPISLIKEVEHEIARSPISNQLAIACNISNASVKYTQDITDESQFDDSFIKGFALELATMICLPLTADKELFGVVKEQRDAFVGEAKRLNGSEGTEKEVRQSRYIDRRNA